MPHHELNHDRDRQQARAAALEQTIAHLFDKDQLGAATAHPSSRSTKRAYEALGVDGQAALRAMWDEQVAERLHALDLAAESAPTSRPWIELDELGRPVRRGQSSARGHDDT